MALSITRRLYERVYIGDDIVVTVAEIRGGKVRLRIEAPKDTKILREELRAKHGREGGASPAKATEGHLTKGGGQ